LYTWHQTCLYTKRDSYNQPAIEHTVENENCQDRSNGLKIYRKLA
jgi:hypothetical protein